MTQRPSIGNVVVHAVTRMRLVADAEHCCVDIKLDGEGGAAVGGPTITVFGIGSKPPVVVVQTMAEADAELKRSYRELLDNAPADDTAAE